jgi:hypothetical protein
MPPFIFQNFSSLENKINTENLTSEERSQPKTKEEIEALPIRLI